MILHDLSDKCVLRVFSIKLMKLKLSTSATDARAQITDRTMLDKFAIASKSFMFRENSLENLQPPRTPSIPVHPLSKLYHSKIAMLPKLPCKWGRLKQWVGGLGTRKFGGLGKSNELSY